MNKLPKTLNLLMLLLLFGSCMTQKVLLSNLPEDSPSASILSISELEINAPKKGQQLFTYEDIEPVTTLYRMPYGSYASTITVNRGDFKYYLENNSDSVLRASFNKIFILKNTSPFIVKMDVDFKYFLERRIVMTNEISVYMRTSLSVVNNSVTVKSKIYEAIEKEKYFTGMLTYPQNKTMNSLFNKASNNIVKQISSDQEIKVLNP
jgi:hypothetical protein